MVQYRCMCEYAYTPLTKVSLLVWFTLTISEVYAIYSDPESNPNLNPKPSIAVAAEAACFMPREIPSFQDFEVLAVWKSRAPGLVFFFEHLFRDWGLGIRA